MAATETAERRPMAASYGQTRLAHGNETKNALKTTEFFAMIAVNAAILSIGYIISRGLAKSGSKYVDGEDPLNRNDR